MTLRRTATPPGLLMGLVTAAAVLLLAGAGFAAYQMVSSSTSSSQPTDVPPPAPPAEAAEGWEDTAARFGEAFTDTAGGRDQWLARLDPLVSPSLMQGYRYTDLTVVPDQDFVRVSGGTSRPGPDPARAAQLHYDGGLVVDITVTKDVGTGRWVVTTAAPQEPSREPGQGASGDKV